jgi:hypothetical protein
MSSINITLKVLNDLIKEFKRNDVEQIGTYPILIWSMQKKLGSAQQLTRVTKISLKRLAEIMLNNNATEEEENFILNAWLEINTPKKLDRDSYPYYGEYSGYESQPLMNYADKHGV